MVKCSVEGCRSNSKFSSADITFHRLPDPRCFPNLYSKWLQRMTGDSEGAILDLVPQGTARVCSMHFTPEDFAMRTDRNRTRRALKINALPTQRLPTPGLSIKSILSTSPNIANDRLVDHMSMSADDMRGKFNNNNESQSPPTPLDEGKFTTNGSQSPVKIEQRRWNEQRPPGEAKMKLLQRLRKRIKMEGEERHSLTITRVVPKSSRPPSTGSTAYEEDESRVPFCFRKKADLRDHYAYVIVPLEPESGYETLLVNENKYFKYDPAKDGCQIWRCIAKNCVARVVTSVDHCSILFENSGVHYHLETKNATLNMAVWSRKASGESWDEPVETGPQMTEPWTQGSDGPMALPQNLPPWARVNQTVLPDSRFGVKDLLAPKFPPPNQLGFPYDAIPPVFTSLSKFSGGQVIQIPSDPYETFRQQLTSKTLLETGAQTPLGPTQVQPQAVARPVIVSTCSIQSNEGYLPSPMSESGPVVCDEGSNGSNSDPLASRMEEPFYQMVGEVDVQNILQKDPLSLEDNDEAKSNDDLDRQGLAEEDAAFFESLGPHLDNLGTQEKELFREKVAAIVSELTKKVASDRYLNDQ